MTLVTATCDECGRRGPHVRLSFRLDPRTLKPIYRRLCTSCRTKLNYAKKGDRT